MVVLDLGHRRAQRRAERLGAELDLARHPRAQLVLLAARQPRHRGRVVRLALDERERLQHGVVQVRGDAAALVLARVVDARAIRARQARDQQRRADDGERAHAQHDTGQSRRHPPPLPAGVTKPSARMAARPTSASPPSARHGAGAGASAVPVRRCHGVRPGGHAEARPQVVGEQHEAAERGERDRSPSGSSADRGARQPIR